MKHTLILIISVLLLVAGGLHIRPLPPFYRQQDSNDSRFTVLQSTLQKWAGFGARGWTAEQLTDPALGAGSVFVTRRGRIVVSKPGTVEELLPEGWSNRFLPSLYRGGAQYDGMVYWFLSRYLEYEDFMKRQGTLVPFTVRQADLIYFFLVEEDHLLFYVVNADGVPEAPSDVGVRDTNLTDLARLGVLLFLFLAPWLPRFVRFRFAVRILLVQLSTALCLSCVLLRLADEYFRLRREQMLANLAKEARREREVFEVRFSTMMRERSRELHEKIEQRATLEEMGLRGRDYGFIMTPNLQLLRYPKVDGDIGNSILETRMRQMLQRRGNRQLFKSDRPRGDGDLEAYLSSDAPAVDLRHMMFGIGNRNYVLWRTDTREDGEYHYLIFLDAPVVERELLTQVLSALQNKPSVFIDEIPVQLTDERSLPRFLLQWPKDGWFRRTDILGSDLLLCGAQSLSIPGVIWWQFVPSDTICQPLLEQWYWIQFLILCALVLIVGIAGYTVMGIYRNMLALRQDFVGLMQGKIFSSAEPELGKDELSRVHSAFRHFRQELASRDKLVPFVANEILGLLRREDGSFSSSFQGQAVVVYADIRGFTSFSEQSSPEEIASMLNRYFSLWQEITERQGGIIERFVGDAVQVVFFANRNPDYVQDAVETAVAVQRRVLANLPIRCGIGIAHSDVSFVMAGDAAIRRHLLALGDAVIRAQELEQQSKQGQFTQIFTDTFVSVQCRNLFDFARHGDTGAFELERY